MTIGSTLSQKVTARHLRRQAMLYVRQSTLHQVLENTESTARQYALRERAVGLGWETARIVVIDQDLGQKGGFRRRS
jgi:DNA invertase Pin-like site-specific DNA recombinase